MDGIQLSQINDPTSASYIEEEYSCWNTRMENQPVLTRRFLEGQAQRVAEALIDRLPHVHFALPDRINLDEGVSAAIPAALREQRVGNFVDQLARANLNNLMRARLNELQASSEPGVTTSAGLMRHAIALHLVYRSLPDGRNVVYTMIEGEEIPSIPLDDHEAVESAITASTDAILLPETRMSEDTNQGGDLLVPYVSAARRFFLPQWVALDDQGHLLVNTFDEATGYITSMQRFLRALHTAVALAPYMVADPTYQQKRYGMLGQLVNQGRALAQYQAQKIIQTLQQRASAQSLNRGLSLSLPYFDDQILELKYHRFQVIPAGRIMFVPSFVVRAARMEQVKVAQDTRLSPSTRKYLLLELQAIEAAFYSIK